MADVAEDKKGSERTMLAMHKPEELAARNEAPVKQQYVRRHDDIPAVLQLLQQTDVSLGAQPISVTSGPTKSKRAMKREQKHGKGGHASGKKEPSMSNMCNNMLIGKCTFGDSCKFSHDLPFFLANRQPDLPGSCPWAQQPKCPYGVTCRWAGSHQGSEDTTAALLAQGKDSGEGAGASGPVGGESGEGGGGGGVGEEAKEATAMDSTAPSAGLDVAAERKSLEESAVGTPANPSDIPVGGVPQSAPKEVKASFNTLVKTVQQQLWKNRYDFSKSDAILSSLGLRISFKKASSSANSQAPPPNKKQRTEGTERADQEAPKELGAVDKEGAPQQLAEKGGEGQGAGGTEAEGCVERKEGGVVSMEAAAETPAEPTSAAVVDVPTAAAAAGPLDAAVGDVGGMHEKVEGVKENGTVVDRKRPSDSALSFVHVPLKPEEKRVIDFRGKTYLAPLTTVGNLPFRRVCKQLGADITVGEMALATNLLQGQASEWALLKRHPCEDLFGVQIAGGFPDAIARTCQLIDETCDNVDFVDINMGCPIDLVCDKGAGSALLLKPRRIEDLARTGSRAMSLPLTLKTRRGYFDDQDVTHTFVSSIRSWGACALTLHGRTRQQRYSRSADWSYVEKCAELAAPTGLQVIGNGDVFSYTEWNAHLAGGKGNISSCMIARGALIKPWVFTEIKEQRHWDISAGERLDILKSYVAAGLEHWGSDSRGVETTRKFLLEWLSYTYRYIPVGLLEIVPQKLQWRAPPLVCRSDLETLMASENPAHWIRISEMLLGPVPSGFSFSPKHKSNAYSAAGALGSAGAQTGGGAGTNGASAPVGVDDEGQVQG